MGRVAAAAVLVSLALLAGCGVRLTDAQAAQLSQARADAQAAARCADAQARTVLLEAVGNRILAAAASLDLPAPARPPEVLVAPDGAPAAAAVKTEADEARAAAADPPAGMLGVILGGVGGVALAALGVLRFSPGAFGLVANLAHAYLAPRATRDMRAAQAKAQDVAAEAVAYGHALAREAKAAGLGDTVEELNARAAEAQDRLGIRAQVDAILAAVKAQAPPPVASLSAPARLPA